MKSIYSIDDETTKLRNDTDVILKNEKENVNKVSLELNKNYDSKTKDDSNKIYDYILKEADYKKKEIEEFYEEQKLESKKVFNEKKDKLVKEFFEKIID